MKCFLDTSAFVALYHRNDTYHETAKKIWSRLKEQDDVLYTTRDVIVETIILVRRRDGFQTALICGNDLWESSLLELVQPSRQLDRKAWDWFKKYADKELSFVDCVSFSVMNDLRIQTAFTFDKNFKQVGFESLEP